MNQIKLASALPRADRHQAKSLMAENTGAGWLVLADLMEERGVPSAAQARTWGHILQAWEKVVVRHGGAPYHERFISVDASALYGGGAAVTMYRRPGARAGRVSTTLLIPHLDGRAYEAAITVTREVGGPKVDWLSLMQAARLWGKVFNALVTERLEEQCYMYGHFRYGARRATGSYPWWATALKGRDGQRCDWMAVPHGALAQVAAPWQVFSNDPKYGVTMFTRPQ